MLTLRLKIGAIVALLVGLVPARFPDYGTTLELVVPASAIAVLVQATDLRSYSWMVLFLIGACVFNPVVPVPFSTGELGAISILALLPFVFCQILLRPTPVMSTASIINRSPRSESI